MSGLVQQVEISLTPAQLAESFWNLNSDMQVEFFAQLYNIIRADYRKDSSIHPNAELQWFFVGTELEKPENKNAKEMLMAIAAPLYLHTLMATEGGNYL